MKNENFPSGSIAVVATPLGNMDDITRRAIETLEAAEVVAAEDTRTARRLLSSLGIADKRYISYHDFNEAKRAPELLTLLDEGARVALISDAGTPTISDPGFDLVRLARKHGHHVFPVPGPSALISFLCASGLPTDSFTFIGFLPRRETKRRESLQNLVNRGETLIFYESPHRIESTLKEAREIFGDREAALGREMTKLHEQFICGTLSDLIYGVEAMDRVRGEICWGIAGASNEAGEISPEELDEVLLEALSSGERPKVAAKEIASKYNLSAKEIYARLNELKEREG
ncbi:MAG: 16S rRNA (cytidine(1402)-2'-O)-methyltransferase [Deltaproteobacteria bacterium]|nr:MAG: 16S rRNA (cytidine(1402)-2'-O)-methyltransferase [Deltaproteobacteria bacterium]